MDESMPSEETKRMRELVAKLPFQIDDEVIEEALTIATDIEDSAEDLYSGSQTPTRSSGSMAEDEYNALLETYETPRRRTGQDGILNGLSVAVKDIIAVKDLRMTCGSRSCEYVPSYDATVVDRLLAEGGEIVGKANCDAYAFGPTGEFSEFGKVINPNEFDRVPGGSSSGSGAAVRGGLVDMSLGTDSGGSVRIPASCCGVVGVKPTHGLVSRYGLADLAPSTDVIGPLAKDVRTAAKGLEAISGHDVRDPSSSYVTTSSLHTELTSTPQTRIAVPESFLHKSTDEVVSVINDITESLADHPDFDLEYIDLDFGDLESAYPLVLAAEYAWVLRQQFVLRGQGAGYNEEFRSGLLDAEHNDHVALRVLPAAYLDAKTDGASYIAGRREAQAFMERVNTVFEEFDILLTPTLRSVPPTYGEVNAAENMKNITGNTMPFSLSGHPAVSVTAGYSGDVPIGVQITAPHFEDKRALQTARLVEAVRDG